MAKTRKRYVNYDSMHSKYGGHHQKSGKWSPEEEMLADKLIQGFQTGTLPDCAEGATLRSYLARKLNCAPMRISKKFAGQCIGKHTYVTNSSNDPQKTMWTSPKPPSPVSKSPRTTRPSRRHSPRSHASSESSQYHYYDSDDTEMTEEDDAYKGPSYVPSVAFARNTRRVTLGAGADSAFSPIAPHPPVTPATPGRTLTPLSPPPAAPSTPATVNGRITSDFIPSALKMEPVDLEEVYHSSYSSSPSCCIAGASACTAHHEEQTWREVLTTLFGETDSSSPVRNIFHVDNSSTHPDTASGGVNVSSFPASMQLQQQYYLCSSPPPPSPASPRGIASAPYSIIASLGSRDMQSSTAHSSSSSSSSSSSVPFYPSRGIAFYP